VLPSSTKTISQGSSCASRVSLIRVYSSGRVPASLWRGTTTEILGCSDRVMPVSFWDKVSRMSFTLNP